MSGQPGFADPEVARRAQKLAVEARKRNKELRGMLAGHAIFEAEVENMARALVDAALGRGDWAREFEVVIDRSEKDGQSRLKTITLPTLDPKERASLIVKCLEFGMGRPGTRKPSGEKTSPEPEPPQEGFEVN